MDTMRKRNHLISLLLCGTLLFGAVAVSSCSQSAENKSETDTDSSVVTAEETLSAAQQRMAIPDNLPEMNFNGETFRISTKQSYLYEIYTEEEDGELLNDSLYQRNRTVEERFNAKIEPVVTTGESDHVAYVRKTIMAGDDAFDLAATYVYTSGPIITDGLYMNWLEMEYNDFSKPWWINGVNEKFQVGNVLYAAVGDTCLSALTLTYGVFYNKKIGENFSVGDIYQVVRDQKWTVEYFSGLIKNTYQDINGDGIYDTGDLYGFAAEAATNLDVYPFAFDIPIIARNAEGIPEIVFNNDKTIKAVETVNALYWDATGSYIATKDYGQPIQMFKNGTAMFTTTWLGNAFSTFRTMEDDYSILPYPKYDELQKTYMTGAMDNYSVLGVPITAQRLEMISILTEALNAQSYKTLFPAYYEQALQTKYARDEESVEMIDLLMAGRNFDFCTLFSSNITGMPWLFRGLVASKSTDFASQYQKNIKGAQAGLDKVIAAYEAHQ